MIDIILDDYKKITEEIIEVIESEEKALELIKKREEIIKKLFNNEEDKDKIRELYLSKNLFELDKKLECSIQNEKCKVKEEIKNLNKMKSANKLYEKNKKINNFFNIKI